MITRIKATGRLIDVVPYGDEFAQLFPEGDFKIYTKDELDFRVDVDWHHYRIQAAIAAMQATITNYEFYAEGINTECQNSNTTSPKVVAIMAVELADALIKELKGGQDGAS